MLRGLAEFAMSGRRQAATVAVLFSLIPLLNILSGAVVALVTLRKGMQEGFLVALWAALPLLLPAFAGDFMPLMVLAGALFAGLALRTTESWSVVLLVVSALGILIQVSLAFQPLYVSYVTASVEQLMAQGSSAELSAQFSSADEMTAFLLLFYGPVMELLIVLCLVFGRHWQALLYNPGGFRREFHALRLQPKTAALLLALIVAGEFGLAPFNQWVLAVAIAPLINGLALAHDFVAKRKPGDVVLVIAYVVALFMSPVMIVLGFLDSFTDLRKRIKPVQ